MHSRYTNRTAIQAHTKVHESTRKVHESTRKVHESTRKYTKVHESTRKLTIPKYTKVHESTRKYTKIHGTHSSRLPADRAKNRSQLGPIYRSRRNEYYTCVHMYMIICIVTSGCVLNDGHLLEITRGQYTGNTGTVYFRVFSCIRTHMHPFSVYFRVLWNSIFCKQFPTLNSSVYFVYF